MMCKLISIWASPAGMFKLIDGCAPSCSMGRSYIMLGICGTTCLRLGVEATRLRHVSKQLCEAMKIVIGAQAKSIVLCS